MPRGAPAVHLTLRVPQELYRSLEAEAGEDRSVREVILERAAQPEHVAEPEPGPAEDSRGGRRRPRTVGGSARGSDPRAAEPRRAAPASVEHGAGADGHRQPVPVLDPPPLEVGVDTREAGRRSQPAAPATVVRSGSAPAPVSSGATDDPATCSHPRSERRRFSWGSVCASCKSRVS